MNFLYNPKHHFNLANLFTMLNIASGLTAVYFIAHHEFFLAIIFAWIGGIFDIVDGKVARKLNLSNEFGIQLDSFADFLSFVLVPVFLIFEAVYVETSGIVMLVCAIVSIYYVISGLRRLIQFNIDAVEGELLRFFVGVPTPLGAILLWLLYLSYIYLLIAPIFIAAAMVVVGVLLNSRVKIPHP